MLSLTDFFASPSECQQTEDFRHANVGCEIAQLDIERHGLLALPLSAGKGADAGLALKAGSGEAQCTAGYSPFLAFQVPDLQAAVERLLGLGARLDGAIKYGPHGKTAALRAPDDHMLSLFESADPPGGAGE